MKDTKALVAEFFGTMFLVIGGCGTAVLAGAKVGTLGVALAFGLSLLVMAYAIGHISGCHINPAVTLAMVLQRKFPIVKAAGYMAAQVIGGVVGALVIYFIAKGAPGFDITTGFATNGFGSASPGGFTLGAAILTELVMTALLTFVVLSTTSKKFPEGFGGIAAGLSLALIHMISIPVTNTSVNPARSIGVALLAGGLALSQLWVFILIPLVGGALGAGIYSMIEE